MKEHPEHLFAALIIAFALIANAAYASNTKADRIANVKAPIGPQETELERRTIMKHALPEELKKLNADTFRAEAREEIDIGDGRKEGWEPFLRGVLLRSDFRIIRARGVEQNIDEMINEIKTGTPYRRVPVGDPEGYVYGDLGVVISVIMLPDNPDTRRDRFQNVKVFIRQTNDWKCVYWQVTKIPAG